MGIHFLCLSYGVGRETMGLSMSIINQSTVLAALAGCIFNIGARFALSDLTPKQQLIFSHPLTCKFVLFCMFFVSTRNVILSICLTAAILFVFNIFINEYHHLSIQQRWAASKARKNDQTSGEHPERQQQLQPRYASLSSQGIGNVHGHDPESDAAVVDIAATEAISGDAKVEAGGVTEAEAEDEVEAEADGHEGPISFNALSIAGCSSAMKLLAEAHSEHREHTSSHLGPPLSPEPNALNA
jgi:hypothetical protein